MVGGDGSGVSRSSRKKVVSQMASLPASASATYSASHEESVLRRVVYLLSVSVAFNTLRTTRESTLTCGLDWSHCHTDAAAEKTMLRKCDRFSQMIRKHEIRATMS
jgi:hypothetical protein